MDEGKNPNPPIYGVDEVEELKDELGEFIDELKTKSDDLVSRMTQLKTALEGHEPTETEMHEASISFHDAQWEYYQLLKKESFDRKHEEAMHRRREFAQKCIMSTLTTQAEDNLIVGMSGSLPWECGN
jgi:hypothetical protein